MGDSLVIIDFLHAMMLQDDNLAAITLAEHFGQYLIEANETVNKASQK
jgi:hypothetical protein